MPGSGAATSCGSAGPSCGSSSGRRGARPAFRGCRTETIRFYHEYEDHGYLSNFYASPIVVDGLRWPTAEHYYQASKTLDPVWRERIRTAATADEAKRLGNDPACPLRPDWADVKIQVMREALAAKFSQHDDLRKRLVATGDAVLLENSKKDSFWGVGADGKGQSMLGRLLMELRESLSRGCLG